MSENNDQMGGSDDPYELDELLGAYALDALEPDERRRVEEYIAVNPRAAAEVQQHREVATMLAFTGMSAPDDVWTKIAAEIDAEAPAPGPELAKVLSMEPRPGPRPDDDVDDDAAAQVVAPPPPPPRQWLSPPERLWSSRSRRAP